MGARVLSVLGSTMKLPPLPSVSVIKSLITGTEEKYSLNEMLGTAGVAGDTWLQGMAALLPNVNFIGTFPGVVKSDVAKTYFPPWLYPIVKAGENLISMSAEGSGMIHAQILVSPNAGRRPVSYFNVKLEGRKTQPLAYDADFGKWVWSYLNETV